MRSAKTKLTIKYIEVEGSAETITSIVKSLGDLFPAPENGQPVTIKTRKTQSKFPVSGVDFPSELEQEQMKREHNSNT